MLLDKTHPYNACVCLAVRRLSRLLTQAYDAALAPAGVTTTQFSLLTAVAAARPDGMSMSPLARAMDMDLSTLSRTLKPLLNAELITLSAGADRRERRVALTKKGDHRVKQATKLWAAVQEQVHGALGQDTHDKLSRLVAKAHALH
jgi:DNA-binding MarR family transcriptional regulator